MSLPVGLIFRVELLTVCALLNVLFFLPKWEVLSFNKSRVFECEVEGASRSCVTPPSPPAGEEKTAGSSSQGGGTQPPVALTHSSQKEITLP